MTVEMINEFMDSVIRGTLTGICFAFWLLCMAGIWKWLMALRGTPRLILDRCFVRNPSIYLDLDT